MFFGTKVPLVCAVCLIPYITQCSRTYVHNPARTEECMDASLHSRPTYARRHVRHDPRVCLPTLTPEHPNIYLQLYVRLHGRLHGTTVCNLARKTVHTQKPKYTCPYPRRPFPLCPLPSRPVVVGVGKARWWQRRLPGG